MDQIELRKTVEIILEKKGFASDIEAKVCLIIDESGSMAGHFHNGEVGRIVDRALAVGYKFDDDGTIDVWSFSDEYCRRPPATQDDHGKYVKHRMLSGSTIYHDVLQAAADDYFVSNKVTGFINKLFGGKQKTETKSIDGFPAFVIFITDGEPNSPSETIRKVGNILESYPEMFVQFIGIGNRYAGDSFPTLEAIAKDHPNCSLAVIEDGDTDEVILDKFLNTKARAVLGSK